jgi:hypothetical protein
MRRWAENGKKGEKEQRTKLLFSPTLVLMGLSPPVTDLHYLNLQC